MAGFTDRQNLTDRQMLLLNDITKLLTQQNTGLSVADGLDILCLVIGGSLVKMKMNPQEAHLLVDMMCKGIKEDYDNNVIGVW